MKQRGTQACRHPGPKGARSQRGFTLVEMLVALAVLVVALSVVATVFDLTTKTTTQAAAISAVQTSVRELMLQLEQDLEQCDPAKSILVLVGRTQAAGLIDDDLPAKRFYRVLTGNPAADSNPEYRSSPPPGYSDPRADLMMFFTQRPTASRAPSAQPANNPYLRGARHAPVQVAYGHASFDRVAQNSGTPPTYSYANDIRHIGDQLGDGTRRSVLPAKEWHLSRRVAIIEPNLRQPPLIRLTQSAYNRIRRCLPSGSAGVGSAGGDVISLNLTALLDANSTPAVLNRRAYVWNAMSEPALRGIHELLFGRQSQDINDRHLATVLNDPPADLRSNLGVQFLPGCAWFQVEFLMPEDPRNALDHPDQTQRDAMPRWVEVPHGLTYVFVPDTSENRALIARNGLDPLTRNVRPGARLFDFKRVDTTLGALEIDKLSNRRVRLWPYAIRVTVRVFDTHGRLAEPLIRSFVHRFD